MPEYNHILAAVDFSPAAEQVVKKAKTLAEKLNCRLSLIHVFEFIPPIDLADAPLGTPAWGIDEQELLTLHEHHLRELCARLGLEQAHQDVISGVAKIEIVHYALAQAVDLIILGSHGRHGIARLLGSTADAVLHHAHCDVLAVKIT